MGTEIYKTGTIALSFCQDEKSVINNHILFNCIKVQSEYTILFMFKYCNESANHGGLCIPFPRSLSPLLFVGRTPRANSIPSIS